MRRLFSLALTATLFATWTLPTGAGAQEPEADSVETPSDTAGEQPTDPGSAGEAESPTDEANDSSGADGANDSSGADGAGENDATPAPSASDADITIAVLPILVSGELAEATRQRLFESLRQGLQRGQFGLADQATIDKLARTGCADQICYRKVRKQTKSAYIVRTFVTILDRDYIIHLDLVDVDENEVVASSEEACEVCGVSEVGTVLDTQAAQFRTKLEALIKEPPMVFVTSAPKGALVTIDNQVVGVTPIERKTLPGEHVIRVSTEGFVPEEREIVSVPGVRETVTLDMSRTPQSIRNRKLGVGFLASGVPLLAGGIVLTSFNYSDV
ncbi:MAG: PEGA domain-containing protein, partial [Nannocystaceae bacterium]